MLVVVSAPSGAGKTSLCHEIRKRVANVGYSISHTTRTPRPGELDGHDFHFVAEAVFRQMIDRGEFAEWARVHGNLYGTSARALEAALDRGEDILLDIDTQGARQLRARYPLGLFVFVVAPSMKELELRLRERKSDAPQEIARRMMRATDEIAAWREMITCGQPSSRRGGSAAHRIIEAERCRTTRVTLSLPDLLAGEEPSLPEEPPDAVPVVEQCLARISNRYLLVVLAAKRSRQLNRGSQAQVESKRKKWTSVALEEVIGDKIHPKRSDQEAKAQAPAAEA
jgi:guanylate kinase